LLGYHLPAAGNLKVDQYFDGYELDTINFKHDKLHTYMHQIDEKVVAETVKTIQKNAPDLSWVYLEYTDDMGHMYGDSQPFYHAVEQLDVQLGKIYDAVNYRKKNFNEDWLFIVTTDHGRDEKDGRGHGGQSARQRTTWMVNNLPRLNAYATYANPAVVDIMPSIARFMGLPIPKAVAQEVDGTPFIGPVSIFDAEVNYIQDKVDISWKALVDKGTIKVWLTTTNNYKTGGTDKYQKLTEVPVINRHVLVDLKNYPSSFYKIVLEAPNNMVNKWVLLDHQK
jgi:arylsulfatase A-like enzyme